MYKVVLPIASTVLTFGILAGQVQAQSHSHENSPLHSMSGMPSAPANASPATKAYMDAIERMHAPMAEGVQASDPDVAFVKGMIPHHQAAIDMARVRMQYGKDPQTKKWAEDVIREQEREIAEMQDWLKRYGK